MKIIIAILLITSTAQAQFAMTFCWDPSPGVVKYTLYASNIPGARVNAIKSVDSITNRVVIDGLTEGMLHHFQVTAKDSAGIESGPSNEVSYLAPRIFIVRPGVLRFWRPINRANVDYVLETADVITGPWTARTPVETILQTDTVNNLDLVLMEIPATPLNSFSRINMKIQKVGCANEL